MEPSAILYTAPTNPDAKKSGITASWGQRRKMRSFAQFARQALMLGGVLWSSPYSISAAVPHFQLRDTHGHIHEPMEWNAHKAIVVFFVTNDCPVANSYVPEMNRIEKLYAARGIGFYAVQADASADPAVTNKYAMAYQYAFPLLVDPNQNLVRLTGATVTPQAVVLSAEGRVLYRGRIDNRVEDFGKQRPDATVHDLCNALDAVLAGKPVSVAVTRSIGCAITRAK